MKKERPFKSKVLLKIIDAVKEKQPEGEELLKIVSERYETVSGKSLWASYQENSAVHPIFDVFEKPREMQAGAIYLLNGGARAWILNVKEEQ